MAPVSCRDHSPKGPVSANGNAIVTQLEGGGEGVGGVGRGGVGFVGGGNGGVWCVGGRGDGGDGGVVGVGCCRCDDEERRCGWGASVAELIPPPPCSLWASCTAWCQVCS